MNEGLKYRGLQLPDCASCRLTQEEVADILSKLRFKIQQRPGPHHEYLSTCGAFVEVSAAKDSFFLETTVQGCTKGAE